MSTLVTVSEFSNRYSHLFRAQNAVALQETIQTIHERSDLTAVFSELFILLTIEQTATQSNNLSVTDAISKQQQTT